MRNGFYGTIQNWRKGMYRKTVDELQNDQREKPVSYTHLQTMVAGLKILRLKKQHYHFINHRKIYPNYYSLLLR